jgi:hypothetical protein
MSASYLQKAYAGTTAGVASMNITFPSPVASGTFIAVYVEHTTISLVTDSAGNVYQRAGAAVAGSVDLWYAYNVIGSASLTLTVTRNAFTWAWYVQAAQFSGVVASSDPYWGDDGHDGWPAAPYDFLIGSVTTPNNEALILIPAYTINATYPTPPVNTDYINQYSCRWWWYYNKPTAGPYTGTMNGGATYYAGKVTAFLTIPMSYWVDIPDWHAHEWLSATDYPGGVARCLCMLWTTAAGPTIQARLVSLLADGETVDEVVGTSPVITATVPTDASFTVALVGTKRHKLQVTSDTSLTDLWCAPGAKVMA